MAFASSIVISSGMQATKDYQIIIGDENHNIDDIIIGGYNLNELLENNRKFKIQSMLLELLSKEMEDLKSELKGIKEELNGRRKDK
jgi:hypothetical protein